MDSTSPLTAAARRLLMILGIAVVMLSPACGGSSNGTPTGPTGGGPGPLTGTWVLSGSNLNSNKATAFTWTWVLTESGSALSGTSTFTFTTVQNGTVSIPGTFSGSVNGSTVTLNITGVVPTGLSGETVCQAGANYSVTGTAQLNSASTTLTLATATLQDGCGLVSTLKDTVIPPFVKQ